MANSVFYILAGMSLFAAVMAMTLRNLFHCALFWVLAMFGVAGIFLYLNAEFLAAVQVIIYVGAVTVFIFFGIMFTRNVMDERIHVMNRQFWLALFTAVFFGCISMKALESSAFRGSDHPLVLTQHASPKRGGQHDHGGHSGGRGRRERQRGCAGDRRQSFEPLKGVCLRL